MIVTRRWVTADRTWFAVAGLDDTLASAAERMGYRPRDGWWCRQYPSNAPHLESAWHTFTEQAERMLRQGARREPVPWRPALRLLCQRTADSGVDWWLTGSAALAVRGVRVEPGDLDLVCAVADVHRLGDLLADVLIDPVAPPLNEDSGWISAWWGRAFAEARIEWVAGVRSGADRPEPSDFGPVAATRLESVDWEDWRIRVPPLAMQREVSRRRGLSARVAAIDAVR
ncbi:MAG TPA: hypothetical protein VJX10_17085 [Pseudonocardiaceae bacterium]|nr:hypothetical protein [Pseudonocardiaceae bacterium]